MKTERRDFLKMVGAAGALAPSLAAQAKPNIIVIMADQQRTGLTRRSGCTLDTMPTLDRLAARGVSFERAYTTAPLCVPARESLLTGRWPHAHRVRQNSATRAAFFEQDLFQVAKSLGYKTGLSGKNHSHLTEERLDFWRPFMHLGGWLPKNPPQEMVEFDKWMQHLNYGVAQEATPFPVETQLPHRIVSHAIEFVKSAAESPFALWVSFPEPHNPYQVPKPYFDMFPPDAVPARAVGPEVLAAKGFKWEFLGKLEESAHPGYNNYWRRYRSNYLGMLRLIDDQVKRLVGYLETSGLLQNTIIVYLTDHGDYFGDYGLMRKGVDLPEVLTRIPMVWAGPGIRAQVDPGTFVSTADILPTLCEAIGAPIPHGVQGRSLWPILQGKAYPKREFESIYSEVGFGGLYYGKGDEINPGWGRIPGAPGAVPTFDELNTVTQAGNMKMVRMGDWKLVFDMQGNGQLYNVAEDYYELHNRYGKPDVAETQSRLLAELLRWTIRTQDDLTPGAYQTKWK